MFSHVTLGSNDLDRARRFYGPVMATLGLTEPFQAPGMIAVPSSAPRSASTSLPFGGEEISPDTGGAPPGVEIGPETGPACIGLDTGPDTGPGLDDGPETGP